MKKLLVFAMGIVMLIGCKKEYHTPSAVNSTPEKTLQTVPKCGIYLNVEFTAKMMKARKPRDEQEKISARKPKDDPNPVQTQTVIYLDANGHTVENTLWNWSGTFHCSAPGLTDHQMAAIIKSVKEDFSTFQITVTSDVNLYNRTSKANRIHVVITNYRGLEHIFPYFGGIAFIGSLNWQDDTPCFVFADLAFGYTPYIAEIVSHEAGHTIGLFHQSEYYTNGTLKYEYHSGFYSLPWNLTWRAIMGSGYNGDIAGWMWGRTLHGSQNDTEILSTLGVYADNTSNSFSLAKQIKLNGATKRILFEELINKRQDQDAYMVNSGEIKFSIIAGGNCDIQVFVYNREEKLIAQFNDQNSLGISEKTIKTKGNKIYLRVVANDLMIGDIQSEIQYAGQYTLVAQKI